MNQSTKVGFVVLLLISFVCAVGLSWALTGLLLRALKGGVHQALPNERSMHTSATPVGGGLAIVATILILVALLGRSLPTDMVVVLAAAAVLSVISALDHYRPLWPLTRLVVQGLAVAVPLALLPETTHFAAAVPLPVERVVLGVAWLWLINLTNFMDGIDGIAAAEGAAVALGVVAVLAVQFGHIGTIEANVAAVLAGACLGYLVWNWAPARIFMGDAGSIPLGYLLGWLLLSLAAKGAWAAAAVLPLLFVADATLTLGRRILRGEKPWRPHRTHFYQRAVQGGATPPHVVLLLTVCNASLILAAVQSQRQPIAVLAAGAIVAWLFLMFLSQWASRGLKPTRE